MPQNSYEIKGNIISTGANSKAFKDNFDRVFNHGKEGDSCLSKQSMPTTPVRKEKVLEQVKKDREQWPDK